MEVTSWYLVILVLKEAPGRKHCNLLQNTCVKQLPVPAACERPICVNLRCQILHTILIICLKSGVFVTELLTKETIMDDSFVMHLSRLDF